MPIKHPAVAAALLLGATLAVSVPSRTAHAQEMGQPTRWLVRGGVSKVDPKSGDLALTSTTRLGVDHDSGFSFDVTQMLDERWGVEIFAAPSLKHVTTADSATDSTPFGKVEPLIETLTGQYHFNVAGSVPMSASVSVTRSSAARRRSA